MRTEIANNNHFILYVTENGKIKVDVLIKDETIWLTINHMAELFSIDKSGISRHIKNIYKTGELKQQGTVAKFATVQNEGQRTVSRQLEYYNLDMIISVGYRVNSIRGTQFRIWSTQQLKELIIKGFVLNDEKLKNPDNPFGKDYFDNLLERISDIRKLLIFLKDETVWLTQKALAELFCAERSVITKHLGNIFKDGELVENSVCAIIAHTASD